MKHEYLREVNSRLESYLQLRVYVLILLVFACAGMVNWFYLPLMDRLQEDVTRTRYMLTFIPTDVLENVKAIRAFLLEQVEK